MKTVDAISGGEAQRLALAILVDSDANLLVLDEPTNHLDVESREALEDALQAFDGSLLLISHDRALLEAVGSRTIVLARRAPATATPAAGPSTGRPRRSAASAQARRGKPRRPGARRARARTGSPTRSVWSARPRRPSGACASSRRS